MPMIEHETSELSIRKQSELLGINRSRIYYQKRPIEATDVEMMNEMVEINKQFPFYGYRRMTVELATCGYNRNHKKVRQLMRKIGLKTLYPKKRTTIANSANFTYPYLLRGLVINHPNQVWSVDITYIKIRHGYIYLVCIIDVFSRKIMGWCLSPYLDTQASIEALNKALKLAVPEIVNSDQGCQYTSTEWTSALIDKNIKISMDGKGRWADNIYIERFWRSLKYESLYLHSFETVKEARETLGRYIDFYNQRRPHQSLRYKTPNLVYEECQSVHQEETNLNIVSMPKNQLLNEPVIGGVSYS